MKMHPKFLTLLDVMIKIHSIASIILLIVIWFCVEDLLLFFAILIPLGFILCSSQAALSLLKIILKELFQKQKDNSPNQ